MNWNLKRALKRRMPTDVEMEAMGCRYLTAEELDAIFGGRPDDGDINDACPPGGNFGGGYSGGSSSGDSSASGSSGSFSGDSSSGDNGGQSGASGNSSNSDNSSSKDYSIQPGDTFAGITHDHYPGLTGQDFVDKVNEIAAANGIENIDNIQAGATISIPGGGGGSSSSGASGASGVGGGSNEHGGNDGEHGGATGTSGNANGKSGKGASGAGTGTTTTPSQAAQQQASGAKGAANGKGKSSGGFWSGVWNGLCAFGNGVKSFFNDPIGTAKGWFGGGNKTSATASTTAKNLANNVKTDEKLFNDRTIKQKELEERYGYPNSLCNATSGINVYRHSDDLSDAKVDSFMKDAKDKTIAADGYVKDFEKMSKDIAKQANSDKYYGYVYPGDDIRSMKTMTPDEFRASDYPYGIGECYKSDNENRTGVPDHFTMIKNNPFEEHNPGVGTYDLERIRPLNPYSY